MAGNPYKCWTYFEERQPLRRDVIPWRRPDGRWVWILESTGVALSDPFPAPRTDAIAERASSGLWVWTWMRG